MNAPDGLEQQLARLRNLVSARLETAALTRRGVTSGGISGPAQAPEAKPLTPEPAQVLSSLMRDEPEESAWSEEPVAEPRATPNVRRRVRAASDSQPRIVEWLLSLGARLLRLRR